MVLSHSTAFIDNYLSKGRGGSAIWKHHSGEGNTLFGAFLGCSSNSVKNRKIDSLSL